MRDSLQSLCRRRNRANALTSDQAVSNAARLIPISVMATVRQNKPDATWTPLALFEYALRVETMQKANLPRTIGQPVFAATASSAMQIDAGRVQPCRGCGEAHLRKNCPHRKTRCAACGKIGHVSASCLNKTLADTAGQRRLLAQPTQKGVKLETRFDNTTPDQLKTLEGMVEKWLVSKTLER